MSSPLAGGLFEDMLQSSFWLDYEMGVEWRCWGGKVLVSTSVIEEGGAVVDMRVAMVRNLV